MPVHYADGKVDIKVITKDVWTLSPGLSFGRAGGTNSTNFNLQDTNFLGWGKALQVSHGSTVDRTSNTVAWTDPNVFGSKWTSAARLRRFERRYGARRAGRASLLFARYAVEHEDYGRQIRPHHLALQSGRKSSINSTTTNPRTS